MRKKNELAVDKILECAKRRIFGKGVRKRFYAYDCRTRGLYHGYALRQVCGQKPAFPRVGGGGRGKSFSPFIPPRRRSFLISPPNGREGKWTSYVAGKMDTMIDIIYDYFDAFKLIVTKSAGSGYEYYIDK